MDYTKVPRELIFKSRDNLKDFGVLTLGTIKHQLFLHLKEGSLTCVEGATERITIRSWRPCPGRTSATLMSFVASTSPSPVRTMARCLLIFDL